MPRVTKKELEEEIESLRLKLQGGQESKQEEADEPIFKEPAKKPAARRGRPPKSAVKDESKVKPVKAKAARAPPKAKRSASKPAVKRGAKIKEVVISAEEENNLNNLRFSGGSAAADDADNEAEVSNEISAEAPSSGNYVAVIPNEDSEREKIKSQFMKLLSTNPNLETKTPGKFKDIARDCNELPIDELKLRLQYAQKLQYDGLDNRIAGDVLSACSALVGGLLRCNDELQNRVKKDEYLRSMTGQALHENVLHLIPNYAKIAGIYSSHVIAAVKDKREKAAAVPAITTVDIEPATIEPNQKKESPELQHYKVPEQEQVPTSNQVVWDPISQRFVPA